MHGVYICLWLLSLATGSDKYISHIRFGEKFWLTLLFKKLFLKGCLTERSFQTAAVMLLLFGTW